MSWFDTSGLASIAKSALKEAQKTIDKALDIKDDAFGPSTQTPIDTNSDDFFGTWGVAHFESTPENTTERTHEAKSPVKPKPVTTSLWGSFTGSFFDSSKEARSEDCLDDSDMGIEHFSGSKLVVQHSEDLGCELDENDKPCTTPDTLEPKDSSKFDNLLRTYDVNTRKHINRLSVISSESGKNSSESVEILSGGTDCTTSPDTDALSAGLTPSSPSSSHGQQTGSDSVEVLTVSLASPSSSEVLGSESSTSQQRTGEFVSPLDSPESLSTDPEKQSMSSVDVLPEEQEESSFAEDGSYASVSETTATTVLETLQHQKRTHHILKDSFGEPITRAPSRAGMILPVNPLLIDTQPLSTAQDLSNLMKNPNLIDIPQETDSFHSSLSETQSNDEGSQSDRTVVANEYVMESSSDTSTAESNNSSYLRHMIADAMSEKSVENPQKHFMDLSQSMIDSTLSNDAKLLENISISQLEMPPRETSPISSESRSDLVKIGSDHTSGHTSADEIETTTSSDIEIISSPNGDSSSTQSRQSPAKQPHSHGKSEANVDVLLGKMTLKKIKGHNRELSEASSVSDDSHSAEIDRLIKRMSEMTDILEMREAKLAEVNRKYADVQEKNCELQRQLDCVVVKQLETADVSQVTEEYTQRLSALEKKFQQTVREKDQLRKQVDQLKQESAQRISKTEMEALVTEKDETIKELREEGEKLSKQQLQHSNIIKKLRAKEKDQEATIKHLRERVEDLSVETERLNRSLTAKDDVERSQIEAIHQLSAKNKKLEKDTMQLQSQLDDLTERFETVKKSNDAAKRELADKNRASAELQAMEQMVANLETERNIVDLQQEQILGELEDLRQKLREGNQENVKKEQSLRAENGALLRRLEDAERRNEELAQSVLEVSKPLVRQLETLQASYNAKTAGFEKIEQELVLKITELQNRLKHATEKERVTREEYIDLRTRMSQVESRLSSVSHDNEMLKVELERRGTEKLMAEQDLKKEISQLQEELKAEASKVNELNAEVLTLQQQLSMEKSLLENEKKRAINTQESMENEEKGTPPRTGATSPTLSLGRASLSESLSSTFWSHDDQLELSSAPRYTNMFEMQMLQSNLKQKEGEVTQLQWELNRREHERTLLNSEISTLLMRVEALEGKLADHEKLIGQHSELQRQYDTLCQLFGEKVEENEELKLDLLDVKDMYKSQIDELLKQQKEKS